MKVVKEFSRFADEYKRHNVIQKKVAKKLCMYLQKEAYENILDLGAGDGEIYKNLISNNINFKHCTVVDFSKEMLDIHPLGKNVQKLCLDFNSLSFKNMFEKNQFEIIFSSSALQWSENLFFTLSSLSAFSEQFYFSFFTSKTFETLHKTANISSPIYSKNKILETLNKIFDYEVEIVNYKLDFDSVYEMLRYIKRSGVGAGAKQLSYREMKVLMLNYPLSYLEFEVMFVKATKNNTKI